MEEKDPLEEFADETPIIEGEVDEEMEMLRESLVGFFENCDKDGIGRDVAVRIGAHFAMDIVMQCKSPARKLFLFVYQVVRTMEKEINKGKEA